jgi:hypothetical protein
MHVVERDRHDVLDAVAEVAHGLRDRLGDGGRDDRDQRARDRQREERSAGAHPHG